MIASVIQDQTAAPVPPTMLIDTISLGNRFRKDMGDIAALAASIKSVGLLHPVVVTPDGELIAGQRRLEACKLLGWREVPVNAVNLQDIVRGEHDENMVRKDFLPTENVAIKRALQGEVSIPVGRPPENRQNLPNNTTKPTNSHNRDKVAAFVGVSGWTLEKAEKVVEAAEREPERFGDLPAKMDEKGKVDAAYKELRKRQQEEARPKPVTAPVTRSPYLFAGRAENMNFLAPDSVDAIITSPPYNLGSEHWPMGGEGRNAREDGIGYADALSEEEYQEWQITVLRELYRVAKPGASLFYNHKIRQKDGEIIHPLDWLRNPDNPWTLRQEIIWDRLSTHNHCPALFWQHDERIYWLTKGKPALPDRSIGMATIWQFHGPTPNTWHPAPFSEELPKRCLEAIGREGIVVLDPFGGSMTTCKVALAMGYEAIGVDTNPEYIKRARAENGWMTPEKT